MKAKDAWLRAQRYKKSFYLRQVVCVVAQLPPVAVFTLWMLDYESETSIFELMPVFRGMSNAQWMQLWGAAFVMAMMFTAVTILIFWRCPACKRFLGGRRGLRKCPHCEATLSGSDGRYG